jgi:phage tail tape-measure protein
MADDRYSTIGHTTTAELEHEAKEEANHDPITGEPGAHPVGTGVGAVGGAATGAAVGGAVGGPAGAMVGAAVGGVVGGLAGKGVAEAVNPTEEEAYWRESHSTRPYAAHRSYDELAPAYRYGWESRVRHADRNWTDVESDLERGWDKARGQSKLAWHEAKDATRDAWHRVERAMPGDADRDGR